MRPGDVVCGIITRVEHYGAWVRLPEHPTLQGLILIPEIAWTRVRHPEDHFEVEQRVEARVICVAEERVSLSTKRLLPDPWEVHAEQLIVGQSLEGRICAVADYGLFVELFPGVEGLVMFDTSATRGQRAEVGARLSTTILDVDREARKIRLCLTSLASM